MSPSLAPSVSPQDGLNSLKTSLSPAQSHPAALAAEKRVPGQPPIPWVGVGGGGTLGGALPQMPGPSLLPTRLLGYSGRPLAGTLHPNLPEFCRIVQTPLVCALPLWTCLVFTPQQCENQ